MTTAKLMEKLERDAPAPIYTDFDLLRAPEFINPVEEKIALDAQKKQIEERIKELGEEIDAFLTAVESDKVAYRDGYVVKRGHGKSPDRIIAARLIEQGVSVDILAAATEEGKEYNFIQVLAPPKPKGYGKGGR